jgi:hypothetical protein
MFVLLWIISFNRYTFLIQQCKICSELSTCVGVILTKCLARCRLYVCRFIMHWCAPMALPLIQKVITHYHLSVFGLSVLLLKNAAAHIFYWFFLEKVSTMWTNCILGALPAIYLGFSRPYLSADISTIRPKDFYGPSVSVYLQDEQGTRWRSWLRHCATSRNVAGSIPDGVIGIFHWHNPFGRTMALGSTQPLTEMSTRNISWGVKAAGA